MKGKTFFFSVVFLALFSVASASYRHVIDRVEITPIPDSHGVDVHFVLEDGTEWDGKVWCRCCSYKAEALKAGDEVTLTQGGRSACYLSSKAYGYIGYVTLKPESAGNLPTLVGIHDRGCRLVLSDGSRWDTSRWNGWWSQGWSEGDIILLDHSEKKGGTAFLYNLSRETGWTNNNFVRAKFMGVKFVCNG